MNRTLPFLAALACALLLPPSAGAQTPVSVRRLQVEGFTDYVIIPIQVQDRHRSAAMSFAAKRVTRFSEEDLADLHHVVAAISPILEARVVRNIAHDLLDTYLGHNAGGRVYAMDSRSFVSAFTTAGRAVWTRDLTPASDNSDDASGGGLAVSGGTLFATTR